MVRRVERVTRVERGNALYPAGLERLGVATPAHLDLFGNHALLQEKSVALFSSGRAPGRVVVETYDLARALAAGDGTVIGGFHSALEREVLDYLLRGTASVVFCAARRLHRMAIPTRWRSALDEGRLLLLSPLGGEVRRPTGATAEFRNRVAAAAAARLVILHATPGGRLARLVREVAGWGLPMHCLDHSANEDLRVLGAAALPRPIAAPP